MNVSYSAAAALALFASSPAMAAASGDEKLDAAVQAYEKAQMNGDRAALEQLLSEDYLLVNSGGAHESKAQFIADLTAPGFKLDPYGIQAPFRRVWADGAVVGGIAHLAGTDGGQRFDACIRYADVWKRDGERWVVVFTHVARASAAPGGCKPE